MIDTEKILRIMGNDSYAELTGLEIVRAEPGDVEVRLPVTQKIRNGHGNVHGGALFTLADYAGALASNLLGEPTMACQCSICYLKAVRDGHVTAKAKTVKAGRRMKFQAVEMFDDAGDMVATFHGGAITVVRKS